MFTCYRCNLKIDCRHHRENKKKNSMERVAFEKLSDQEKWHYLESLIVGNQPVRPYMPPKATIQTVKPNWIGPLYTNIPFPHYHDKNGTTITQSASNIFNGSLHERSEKDHVDMDWHGYVTQVKDGEFKMAPAPGVDQSWIKGYCNGVHFLFKGTRLVQGVWPGFLLMYGPPPVE